VYRHAPRFVFHAGLLLAATGLAKVFSAIGPAKALDVPDPIFGLAFRQVLLGVGLVELLVAFFCFFTDKARLCLFLIAWLATNFLVYRLGLWWIGWHKPCGCLGNLTDALHISPQVADNLMKAVLAYLLVGSYWLLWSNRRSFVGLATRNAKTPQEKQG
jgi:hypothetical protein